MNMRFALLVLAGTALVSGCSAGTTRLAHGPAQPQATRQTAAAPTPLTQEQRQKIAALHAATLQRLAPKEPRLAAAQSELRRLWSAKKPDPKAILTAQKRLLKLVDENLAVENEFHLGLRKILTAGQRVNLLGDRVEGVGSRFGGPPNGRGAGLGQMLGGALSGGIAGAKGGGGYGGFLTGYLGSLFGEESGAEDEEEGEEE